MRQSSARLEAASRSMQKTLLDCVGSAGKILVDYFGKRTNPRRKESPSSIVCDADLAAEACAIKQIRTRFPEHNIISEESGRTWNDSEFTWVIDPLDGTANFVAGLPWFGVQVALLRGTQPIFAAMHLPIQRQLYTAALGTGAFRNKEKVAVTPETDPRNVLCAFGFDPSSKPNTRRAADLLVRVAQAVRNTRATNSLVDFCYTVDGRLGACMNLKAKIWDIAPVALILPEAGGVFTEVDGTALEFDFSAKGFGRDYTLLGGSAKLHPKLVKVVRAVRS